MVETISELRNICQNLDEEKQRGYIYAYLISGRISIYITRILLHTKISANGVTFLSILVGILAGIFFLKGTVLFYFWGTLLLQLWYILDRVDGEVAQYRGTQSITGRYFDDMASYIVKPFVFVCLGIGLFLETNNVINLFFGILVSFSLFLQILVKSVKHTLLMDKLLYFPNHKHFAIKKREGTQISNVNVSSKRNMGQKISRAIFRFPGVMNVITISAILNLFQFYKYNMVSIDFLQVILIFYGIFLPYFWIKSLYLNVRNGIEEEYFELLRASSERLKKECI